MDIEVIEGEVMEEEEELDEVGVEGLKMKEEDRIKVILIFFFDLIFFYSS